MKLRHSAALGVALVTALALGWSKGALAQTPVKIGVFGILAEAGLFVAQERGYFKQEGLDVEFLPGMVGAEAFPALATGRIERKVPNGRSACYVLVPSAVQQALKVAGAVKASLSLFAWLLW